jgi:Tetratricopeptide repeat.
LERQTGFAEKHFLPIWLNVLLLATISVPVCSAPQKVPPKPTSKSAAKSGTQKSNGTEERTQFYSQSDRLEYLGYQALKKKDYAKAESYFLQMFKIDPHYAGNDLATFYNNRGCELIKERDLGAIFNAFYKAYLMDPSNNFAKNNIKNFAKVPDDLTPSKDHPTTPSEGREMLGDYWLATGAYLYALAEYEMLERAQFGGERILNKMWNAYREAKIDSPNLISAHEQTYPRLGAIIKREKGAGNFREPEVEKKDAFWLKLDRLAAKTQYEKVIEELTAYLQSNQNDMRAMHRLARAYFHAGELEKAESEAKKILEVDPKSYDAYDLLGDIFSQENKFDEALANLDKAITINPDRDRAYRMRALVLYSLNKEDEMKAEAAKAKEKAAQSGRYVPDGEPNMEDGVYVFLVYPLVVLSIQKQVEPHKAELAKLPADKKLIATVEISIDRKGAVSGQKLKKPCGDEQLDQCILSALKSITKAPPIPCGQAPTLEISYPIMLNPNYKSEKEPKAADGNEEKTKDKLKDSNVESKH